MARRAPCVAPEVSPFRAARKCSLFAAFVDLAGARRRGPHPRGRCQRRAGKLLVSFVRMGGGVTARRQTVGIVRVVCEAVDDQTVSASMSRMSR
jgi:hypothetical protein